MVAVVFFALVSMAYISATLTSSLALKKQSRSQVAAERAHEIAESAVHHLVAQLATSARVTILAAGKLDGQIKGNSGAAHDYQIKIWSAAADGADNDQDGLADDPDEANLLEVRSRGTYDNITRTVRVTLLERYRASEVTAATYLDNTDATLSFSGSAFRIKGEDHDMSGNLTGDKAFGIGVAGDPSDVLSQISAAEAGYITGAGGSPSVAQVARVDMADLIAEGARGANVTLTPETTTGPQSAGAWGTVASPAIVYSPGKIKIANGSSGAGLLIIDGDLDISGSFDWIGVIIVRGAIRLTGGGSSKRLIGALIAQTKIDDNSNVTNLQVRGTIDILFSRQAVTKMMASFATYTILNWREGANAK